MVFPPPMFGNQCWMVVSGGYMQVSSKMFKFSEAALALGSIFKTSE
jgi:hypothetical protein